MAAARDFAEGELVLCEEPLLAFELFGASPRQEVLAQFQALAEERKTLVADLSDCYALPGRPKSLHGIVETNNIAVYSLGLEAAASAPASALGVVGNLLSRMNHSCAPSCEASWTSSRRASGRIQVRTSSAVQEGAELTLFYEGGLHLRAPRAERQGALSGYGFRCACEVCRLQGEEAQRSDERRARMGHVWRGLCSGGAEDAARPAPEALQELLRLYDEATRLALEGSTAPEEALQLHGAALGHLAAWLGEEHPSVEWWRRRAPEQ
ncbi:unnamed protein product [Prorocentrum cordatum]|uniref:SET domain-containing protein n=1 Tax=Prorocentrum cordatum TaxID=2364126 RepID=A0ABN9V0J6_9DINO|nr:unnamed protein product [Polarella glacialis]